MLFRRSNLDQNQCRGGGWAEGFFRGDTDTVCCNCQPMCHFTGSLQGLDGFSVNNGFMNVLKRANQFFLQAMAANQPWDALDCSLARMGGEDQDRLVWYRVNQGCPKLTEFAQETAAGSNSSL